MSEEVLKKDELEDCLRRCPEWEIEGEAILREWEFEEFMDLMDFVNLVADIAEAASHHPDFYMSYNKLRLSLSTHEIGGVTEADVEMACRIDNLCDG